MMRHSSRCKLVVAVEIRTGKGWDKWNDEEQRDMLRQKGFPVMTSLCSRRRGWTRVPLDAVGCKGPAGEPSPSDTPRPRGYGVEADSKPVSNPAREHFTSMSAFMGC